MFDLDQYSVPFYAIIFLVSYILTKHIIRKFQNLPPSPFPTLPILGHLHLLKNPNSLHRTFANLSAKYGPVVSLQFGSMSAIVVSSPAAAEECLNHNDVIFANRPRFSAAAILGYGYSNMLWAPYGPLWRNHRKIASTEILSPHRLNSLSDIRADEVRLLIRRIKATTEVGDGIFTIKPMLFELTNNVMMRMIAGKRFYGEGTLECEEAKRFRTMVKELLEMGGAISIEDIFPCLKFLGLVKRKFTPVFNKMDGIFQDLVTECRKKMEDGNESSNKKNKNMIEVLLELQKQNVDPSYFTDVIIKGLVQILLLAGTETSSSTTEWALALLLNNPEVLHKARKEIDEQVGSERLIEEADLSRLPYLHCVINETLRMYPAAPLLPPHENSSDCIIGGYRVPKGTMLMLNVWAIQNDPKIWDEPSVFKPERFENLKGDHKFGYTFMPFGSGRRACPGENLALRVVGLVVASLIQCFELERTGEELVDMEEKFAMSMWKANPLQAKCRPRKDMVKLLSDM